MSNHLCWSCSSWFLSRRKCHQLEMHIQRLFMNRNIYADYWPTISRRDSLQAQMGTVFIIRCTKCGHLIAVHQKQAPLNHGKPVQISIPSTRTYCLFVTLTEYSIPWNAYRDTIRPTGFPPGSTGSAGNLPTCTDHSGTNTGCIPNDELLLVPVTWPIATHAWRWISTIINARIRWQWWRRISGAAILWVAGPVHWI